MLAVTGGDAVYWTGVAAAFVAAILIEPRLARRGWDVPQGRSLRLLTLGLLLVAIGVTRLVWGFVVAGAVVVVLYILWHRRRPAGLGEVTSARGERAVTSYLKGLSSTVPTVGGLARRDDPGPITIESIGTYERRGERWHAQLAVGPLVTFVLRAGGRAEFTAEDVHRHATSVGERDVSLGDVHAALAAMCRRGVVDLARPGWYTVLVTARVT